MKPTSVHLVRVAFLMVYLLNAMFFSADSAWVTHLEIKLPSPGTALSYSLDGGYLLVGHSDGDVTVWNAKTGAAIHTIDAHSSTVKTVSVVPRRNQVVTIGSDGLGRLWSVVDWTRQGQLEGIAFLQGISKDGQWLVAQDPMTNVKWLWDITTLQKVHKLEKSGASNNVTPVSTDTGIAYVDGGRLYFVDGVTKAGGEIVAPGIDQEKTKVQIEVQNQNRAAISLGETRDDDAPIYRISTAPTSTVVAVSRRWMEGFVDIWRLDTKQRIARLKPEKSDSRYKIFNTSFSFDGSLLVIDGQESISIWEVTGAKQMGKFKGNGPVVFSPASSEFAMIEQQTLKVYSHK